MHYKALILDLDGTTVPNRRDGHASPRVKRAIEQISDKMKVCAATGRPLMLAQSVLDDLPFSGLSILNNGTQLYDPVQKSIVEHYPLTNEQCKTLLSVVMAQDIPIHINTLETMDIPYTGQDIDGTVLSMFAAGLEPEKAKTFIRSFSGISGIAAHTVTSWQKERVDVEISAAVATKQHGVIEICKRMDISPGEIIGVGDSYNDYPLLMASGLKIAMRNAVDELKAIADFIAPSIDDDGVAVIIEKLLLPYI